MDVLQRSSPIGYGTACDLEEAMQHEDFLFRIVPLIARSGDLSLEAGRVLVVRLGGWGVA